MEEHETVVPLKKETKPNNKYSPTKNLKLKMRKMEIQEQETKEPANKESNSNNQYSPKTQHDISNRIAFNFPEVDKKITCKKTSNQLENDNHYNMEEKKQELNPISVENQYNKNTEEIHNNHVKTETKGKLAENKIESEEITTESNFKDTLKTKKRKINKQEGEEIKDPGQPLKKRNSEIERVSEPKVELEVQNESNNLENESKMNSLFEAKKLLIQQNCQRTRESN